jgi:hypothetical protein
VSHAVGMVRAGTWCDDTQSALPAEKVTLDLWPRKLPIRCTAASCLGGATTRSKVLHREEPSAIDYNQLADLRSLWLAYSAFATPQSALSFRRSRPGIGAHALSRPPWPLTPILLCEAASREVGMALGSAGTPSTSVSLSPPCVPVSPSPFPVVDSGPRSSVPVLHGGNPGQPNADSRMRIGVFFWTKDTKEL